MNNVFRWEKRHKTHTHIWRYTSVWAQGVFHSQLGTPAAIIIISFVQTRLCVKVGNMVGHGWRTNTNAYVQILTLTHTRAHTHLDRHVDNQPSLILLGSPVSDLGLQTIIKWKTNPFCHLVSFYLHSIVSPLCTCSPWSLPSLLLSYPPLLSASLPQPSRCH